MPYTLVILLFFSLSSFACQPENVLVSSGVCAAQASHFFEQQHTGSVA